MIQPIDFTPTTLLEVATRDQQEFDILSKTFSELLAFGNTDDPMQLVWAECEKIKNKWGGHTPSSWISAARDEIAAAWNVGAR